MHSFFMKNEKWTKIMKFAYKQLKMKMKTLKFHDLNLKIYLKQDFQE